MIDNKKSKTYAKHHSFSQFYSSNGSKAIEFQRKRILSFLKNEVKNDHLENKEILNSVFTDLQSVDDSSKFRLTQFITDELETIDNSDLKRYLIHRYRYDIFPQLKKIDSYPPYLQIEPTSVCNYRCVFCYQTDSEFTKKSNGFMGNMKLDHYKDLIDQIEGKVEFISLASRGEPLLNKQLPQMLDYSVGKFLNLKINTNAYLLSESMCHSILNGAIKTVVFSADAAKEPLYSQMRVNGKLDKVLKNIEQFNRIRDTHYKESKVITRVSGVLFSEDQNMEDMKKLWGSLVDQISFVKYNPWENIYSTEVNNINTACSDLWRRMFVWYDGTVNPCDSDYRSILKVSSGHFDNISNIWKGSHYQSLRDKHLSNSRSTIEPCKRCSVV